MMGFEDAMGGDVYQNEYGKCHCIASKEEKGKGKLIRYSILCK